MTVTKVYYGLVRNFNTKQFSIIEHNRTVGKTQVEEYLQFVIDVRHQTRYVSPAGLAFGNINAIYNIDEGRGDIKIGNTPIACLYGKPGIECVAISPIGSTPMYVGPVSTITMSITDLIRLRDLAIQYKDEITWRFIGG